MLEPLNHLDVQRGWLVPSIDYGDSQLQILAPLQELLNHPGPLLSHADRDFREPISWQVNQNPAVIDIEKVDDLSPTRGRTRSGEILFAYQTVN